MNNKLSELSSPVAYRNKYTDILHPAKDNDMGTVAMGTAPTIYSPLYSQEYVSALLEKLKVTESDRDKSGWYVYECARLQKLLERHGVKYE